MCDMQKMPSREDASCEEDSDMNFATFTPVGTTGTHFMTTSGQLPVQKLQQNVANNGAGMPQVCVMGDGGVQYMRAIDTSGTLQATPQLISVPVALPGAKPGDPQATVQIQVLSPNLLPQQPKYQMQIPIQGYQQVLTVDAGGIQLVGQGSLGEGLQVLAALPQEMQLVQPTQEKEQIPQNMPQVYITPNQQIIINGADKALNNNTTSDNHNPTTIVIKEECDDDESSQGTEIGETIQWQLDPNHQQDIVKYLRTLPPQQTQALPESLQQFLRLNPTDIKQGESIEIEVESAVTKKEEPVAEAVLSEGKIAGPSSDKRLHELKLQLKKDVCKHSQKKVVAAIAHYIDYIRETRKRQAREKAQTRLKNAQPQDGGVVIILDDDEEINRTNDANVNRTNDANVNRTNDANVNEVNSNVANPLAYNTIRVSSFARATNFSTTLIRYQEQPQVNCSSSTLNPDLNTTHRTDFVTASSDVRPSEKHPPITSESSQKYLPYTFQALVESAPHNIDQHVSSTVDIKIPKMSMKDILHYLDKHVNYKCELLDTLLGLLMLEVQSTIDPKIEMELIERLRIIIERRSKNSREKSTEQVPATHCSFACCRQLPAGEVLGSSTSVNLLTLQNIAKNTVLNKGVPHKSKLEDDPDVEIVYEYFPENHTKNTKLNESVPNKITPKIDPDVEIIREYFPANQSNHEVHKHCESRDSKEDVLANIFSDKSLMQNRNHNIKKTIAEQNNKIMSKQCPQVYETGSVIHNQSEPEIDVTTKGHPTTAVENISAETVIHNHQNVNKSQTSVPSVIPINNLTESLNAVENISAETVIRNSQNVNKSQTSVPSVIIPKRNLTDTPENVNESGPRESNIRTNSDPFKLLIYGEYARKSKPANNSRETNTVRRTEIKLQHKLSTESGYESSSRHTPCNPKYTVHKTTSQSSSDHTVKSKSLDLGLPIYEISSDDDSDSEVKCVGIKEMNSNKITNPVEKMKESISSSKIAKTKVVSNDKDVKVECKESEISNCENEIKQETDFKNTIEQNPVTVYPDKIASSSESRDEVALFLNSIDLLDIPLPPGKPILNLIKEENIKTYSPFTRNTWKRRGSRNLSPSNVELKIIEPYKKKIDSILSKHSSISKESLHLKRINQGDRELTKEIQFKTDSKKTSQKEKESGRRKSTVLPKYVPYIDRRRSHTRLKSRALSEGQTNIPPSKNPIENKTIGFKIHYKDWDRIEESEPRSQTDDSLDCNTQCSPQGNAIFSLPGLFKESTENVENVPTENQHLVGYETMISQNEIIPTELVDYVPSPGYEVTIDSNDFRIDDDLDNIGMQLEQSALLTNATIENSPAEDTTIVNKASDDVFDKLKDNTPIENNTKDSRLELVTDTGNKTDVRNESINTLEKEKNNKYIETETVVNSNDSDDDLDSLILFLEENTHMTNETFKNTPTELKTKKISNDIFEKFKSDTSVEKDSCLESVTDTGHKDDASNEKVPIEKEKLNNNIENRALASPNTKNNYDIINNSTNHGKQHKINTCNNALDKDKEENNTAQTSDKTKKSTIFLGGYVPDPKPKPNSEKKRKPARIPQLKGIRKIINERRLTRTLGKIITRQTKNKTVELDPPICRTLREKSDTEGNKTKVKLSEVKSVTESDENNKTSLNLNKSSSKKDLKDSRSKNSSLPLFGDNNSLLQPTTSKDDSLKSDPRNVEENSDHATNKLPKLKIFRVDLPPPRNMHLRKRTLSTYKCVECPLKEDQKESSANNDKNLKQTYLGAKNKQTTSGAEGVKPMQTRSSTNSIKLYMENNTKQRIQVTKKIIKSNDNNIFMSDNKKKIKLDKKIKNRQEGLGTCACINKCPLKISTSKQLLLRKKFYGSGYFENQIQFLRNYLELYWNITTDRNVKKINYILRYTLPNVEGKKVRVCKKFFKETFILSDARLHKVIMNIRNRKKNLMASLNRMKR